MDGITIKKIKDKDALPLELLLLADPCEKIVMEYCNRGECYGAYMNEKLIGIFVLIVTRPETIEIVNIAVDEKYQGKGIGKTLIFYAIEVAQNMGMKTIEIGTGNSSLAQLALYKKCGFRVVGVHKNFFIGRYDEEIFENGIQCIDMIRLSKDLVIRS